MSIHCVTFDLDDTLWAIQPVIANAEKHYYTWLQENLPKIPEAYYIEDLTAHRHGYFKNNPHLHHDLTRLRKDWMALVYKEFDYPMETLEEGFLHYWHQRNNVVFFDQAIDVLEQTNNRYITGALTNGNADVNHIGIGEYFNFFLTSAETGSSKPGSAMFNQAIKLAECPAEQIVHVGDDAVTDVAGAAKVGMKTVWVNPLGQVWPGGSPPDAEIKTISELPRVLEKF